MSAESDRFARPRVAAGALFLDDEGRVLLVHPTYKDRWDIPGGYVEQGEAPAAACAREIHEELGLHHRPRRLLAVDWAPHEHEGDKLLFIFDCGSLGRDANRIKLDRTELNDWQWATPSQLDEFLPARLARRIRSTIEARENDSLYLEHGLPLLTAEERPP